VGNEETGLNVTAIRIDSLLVKDLPVEVNVVVVDGVIEGDGDHLGDVLAVGSSGSNLAEVSRDLSTVLGTETVREFANGGITWRCSIRIGIDIAGIFV